MRDWKKLFERTFAAASFAEAGEHYTAMEIAGIKPVRGRMFDTFSAAKDKIFAAVTYAEAGCPETALEFLKKKTGSPKVQSLGSFLESVGLQGVRVRYGLVMA